MGMNEALCTNNECQQAASDFEVPEVVRKRPSNK